MDQSEICDSDVCGTAGRNREKNRGAAALPAQRMMALGPGGVATARGCAGRPTRALSARLTT
eukprot:scaffold17172_cov36-Cyclotella_meneghiniana.AAC.1